MSDEPTSASLTVAGLAPEEAGRGIVRLGTAAMESLGVEPGDVLELRGRRTTVGKAMPPYGDDPDDVVRIDGTTRLNVGAAIDDRISVAKTSADPAERVTVALPPNISLRGAEPFLTRALRNRPLLRGDAVRIGFLGQPIAFVVTKTSPIGPVLVTGETQFSIRAEPLTEADLEAPAELPAVTYEDVGGLDPVITELVRAIEWPLRHPQLFERFNTEAPKGVLLYGPPGTGKTLLAKAVANATDANFITVKGPELLDKFVGESERAVREVFHRARQNAPAIVFFDEIDALAPERGESFDSHVTERVVSQLLTELDGIEELSDVLVLGATNRPDIVDRALLRPGRLEKVVYVPTPDRAAREAIFRVHTRGVPIADDVDLEALAAETDDYTGGDIEAVVREASMLAMAAFLAAHGEDATYTPATLDELGAEIVVTRANFEGALQTVKPSVTSEMREFYEAFTEELGGVVGETAEDAGLGFA
jgi:transitional endoplasmic reticulum ATPase